MEIKDQLNQNPEEEKVIVNQDEKPAAENTAKKSNVAEPQLKEEEKAGIISMITGKKADVIKSSDIIAEDVKQISVSERIRIITLITGKFDDEHQELYDDIDVDELNKQELVEILEEIVEDHDITKIKSQVAKVKAAFYQQNREEIANELSAFVNDGGKEEDFQHVENPLEARYNKAIGKYRHHKSKYSQDLEKQKVANLEQKYALLEDLKELINSEETLKKTYDEFKILQDRWKEIGMVPATELRNLWQSYHFLVEKFFDKVRINRELRDLDLKKNLETKIELCEKAEELLVEKSIIKSFKKLQYFHEKWREVGPVPSDVKEDIWERFKGITDNINKRRKEYYKELQDQQQGNYEAKVVLCEKAKTIVDEPVENLKDWQSATDRMNELLKLWKTIGRAPKAKNDEVWDLFKGSLDAFFNSKREFLNELKEQQVNNYNLKVDLCSKAESIKESNDWGATTKELIRLQKEWKDIGPVPRKYSDKIWKRFRASCDEFFNLKSEHFKTLHGAEDENMKNKKVLVEEISGYDIVSDKNANLAALRDFQKRWIEIGFVPFKEKEQIQNEYRKAVDSLIEKMDVNRADISASDFQEKVDLLKSSPEADKRISKERSFIRGKISKIQEDLNIWENNIGFFSSSKGTNKLIEGFELKIKRAKDEIESLKAKLKMLR